MASCLRVLLLVLLFAAAVGEEQQPPPPIWSAKRWQPPAERFYDAGLVQDAVSISHPRSFFPLLAKLHSGHSITVVMLGSSVVHGSFGNAFGSRAALFAMGAHACTVSAKERCGAACAMDGVACRESGTAFDLLAHINETWPHANHTLATRSSLCLIQLRRSTAPTQATQLCPRRHSGQA